MVFGALLDAEQGVHLRQQLGQRTAITQHLQPGGGALRREQAGASLAMPPPELLPGYLTGLEQALAIGLAARHPGGENFLYHERAIFDHLFDVALQGAQLLRPRLLLVNALENESRRRPDIVREYLAKLALLQRQHAPAAGRGRELVEQGVQTLAEKAAAA